MKKCILWGTGQSFNSNINLIKYYENNNELKIIGITSKNSISNKYLGYEYIPPEDILTIDFDIIVVMGVDKTYEQICSDAKNIGIKEEKIVHYKLLGYPWFNFDKYLTLRKSKLTIFAENCWGGITYNFLKMQFNSPFINMYQTNEDFIKILKKPQHYMNQNVEFLYTNYDENLKKHYPVCKCDDVILHFNHYNSYEQAIDCWNRRKTRINWENILAMTYTENIEALEQFIELPYRKKYVLLQKNTNIHKYIM